MSVLENQRVPALLFCSQTGSKPNVEGLKTSRAWVLHFVDTFHSLAVTVACAFLSYIYSVTHGWVQLKAFRKDHMVNIAVSKDITAEWWLFSHMEITLMASYLKRRFSVNSQDFSQPPFECKHLAKLKSTASLLSL